MFCVLEEEERDGESGSSCDVTGSREGEMEVEVSD